MDMPHPEATESPYRIDHDGLAKRLDPVIEDAVSRGRIVGTTVILAADGEIAYSRTAGFADRESGRPMTEDTIFRLASMTKPLVSAAAMTLIEQGALRLDSMVSELLPWFRPMLPDGSRPDIAIRHLLTHTAGLGYGFLSSDNEPYRSAGISDGMDGSPLSLRENLGRLAEQPLLFPPGTSWCYSLATDVLGAVLEEACGQSLPEIVENRVTGPLGMTDTGFAVRDIGRLATAYADAIEQGQPARRMADRDAVPLEGCGPIHYAPGRITAHTGYPSGGSGMAGTAADYLRFLEAVRKGGAPILGSRSVTLMTTDAVAPLPVDAAGPGFGFGYGFAVVRDSRAAGTPRLPGSYGWGGVYGTSAFVDPKARLSVAILTNTALEGLTGAFPGAVTAAIYSSLTAARAQ